MLLNINFKMLHLKTLHGVVVERVPLVCLVHPHVDAHVRVDDTKFTYVHNRNIILTVSC